MQRLERLDEASKLVSKIIETQQETIEFLKAEIKDHPHSSQVLDHVVNLEKRVSNLATQLRVVLGVSDNQNSGY